MKSSYELIFASNSKLRSDNLSLISFTFNLLSSDRSRPFRLNASRLSLRYFWAANEIDLDSLVSEKSLNALYKSIFKLIEFWEREMKIEGHDYVMTSTLSSEQGQHFYRRLGYRDRGGLLFPEDLYPEEPFEIILTKVLK